MPHNHHGAAARRPHRGTEIGVSEMTATDQTVEALQLAAWTCECGSATFGDGNCKHVRCLKAALEEIP